MNANDIALTQVDQLGMLLAQIAETRGQLKAQLMEALGR